MTEPKFVPELQPKRPLRELVWIIVGWILVVVGVVALVLPGPGMLMVFSGLAILSQRYEWAEKRLRPVEVAAMRGAAKGVETWPRIISSLLGSSVLIALGVLWLVLPAQPGWWPLPDWLWLPGGRMVGVTLIFSGLVAVGLVVWSYRTFRNKPEAVAKIEELAARTTPRSKSKPSA